MKERIASASPSPDDGSCHLAALESSVFARLFNLVSHCAVTRYDSGKPRKTGWFTIKTMGASWVVQVKDPDSCQSLQAIGQTLDDALALADLLLGQDSGPWEYDKFLAQQNGKGSKK